MVNQMTKTFKFNRFLFLLLVIFALGSCNDSIFHMISLAEKMVDPLIKGSPTNFAVLNDVMYVASGSNLYGYYIEGDKSIWNTNFTNPGGRIVQLAATTSELYALCLVGTNINGVIKYKADPTSAGDWTTLEGINAHSIHALGNDLFYSFRTDNTYKIFKLGTTDPIIENADYELQGVTDNFLCAGRIYTNTIPANIHNAALPTDFMGIIDLGTYNVAITRNGNLYNINTGEIIPGADFGNFSNNTRATGVLAIALDTTKTVNLLLAGRQDINYSTSSGFTYGYAEIELDGSGIIEGSKFVRPGTATISTVSNGDRYISTIGRNPLSHIIQAPAGVDPERTLFASTQRNGVWSYEYRDHLKDFSWNAVPE